MVHQGATFFVCVQLITIVDIIVVFGGDISSSHFYCREMLIKLFIDDSFPVEVPGGPQTVMWLVNENLPVQHQKQAEALLKALRLPLENLDDVDLSKLYFQFMGQWLDTSKTFQEQNVKAGCVLTITANAPSPKASRIRSETSSPRGISMMQSSQFDPDDDENQLDETGGSPRGGASSDDEYYEAYDCGWFPFTVANSNYGEVTVQFPNPDIEPHENDPMPNMHQLCEDCSDIVQNNDTLHINVDKHYKPMLMKTDVVEGKVEKVGGSRFPRWQNRYLMISEKSLDWYEGEPKPGTKAKTRGSRMIYDGVRLMIKEVIENPDPAKYPKCKEAKFFHFGVTFEGDPPVTMLFRVTTLQDRNKYTGFLNSIVKRAQNKGASRDPVHWKKWANAFLINMADLGELSYQNDIEEEELMEEIKNIEREIDEVKAQKPPLAEKIAESRNVVKSSLDELSSLKDDLAAFETRAKEAEAKVAVAMEEFRAAESDIAEEMKTTMMLEGRALKKRDEVYLELKKLEAELEDLKQYQTTLFSRWRKGEENHGEQHTTSTERALSFSMDGSLLTAGEANLISRSSSVQMLSPYNSRSGSASRSPSIRHSLRRE